MNNPEATQRCRICGESLADDLPPRMDGLCGACRMEFRDEVEAEQELSWFDD